MPVIRLPSDALASSVPDGFAMAVHLTAHQVDQLWRGEVITVGDGAARRLADALGVSASGLLARGGSSEESEVVYDDAPPTMASEGRSRAVEREPVDMPALFERTLEQLVAESEGQYTDEDAELVVSVLGAGELPSSLTPREVPGFLRAWLEPAQSLRAEGHATPEGLLARVERDAPKGAAKMAAGIRAKVERSKAGAKSPKKPASA